VSIKKILLHPIVIFLISLASLLLVFSLYQNAKEITNSTADLKEVELEVDQKQQKIDNLENQLNQAQTNFTKEKIIRDELLMQKEGELVIQIPEDQTIQIPQIEPIQPVTPWQEWKKLILKN